MTSSEPTEPKPEVRAPDSQVDSDPSSKIRGLLDQSAAFDPNFTVVNSVTLPYPIDRVFHIFGHGETLEPSIRLSDLCVDFALLHRDEVALKPGELLTDDVVRLRDRPRADATQPPSEDGARVLPRQYFRLAEAVPILGLYKHRVDIAGALTWDEPKNVALYETAASGGVLIRKLRVFEPTADGGTKITETIVGKCSALLKSTVKSQTEKGHRAHLESYHKLFEGERQ